MQVAGVRLVDLWQQDQGSGIAVRFSCACGRCQSHLDQVMAADLFQKTLWHLVFSILLRCCLSLWLSKSVWHACPLIWPVFLWSSGLCLSCRLRWGTEDYPCREQLGWAGPVVFCCQVAGYSGVEEVPSVRWMMVLSPRESGALHFCHRDSLVWGGWFCTPNSANGSCLRALEIFVLGQLDEYIWKTQMLHIKFVSSCTADTKVD